MDIKNQVCTLAQAKRLKELGVCQESIFSYFKAPHHAGICNTDMSTRHVWILSGNPYDQEDIELTAAFTVAELGVMLPDRFLYNGEQCFVDSTKYCNWKPWIAGVHTVWAHNKPVVAKKYIPAETEAEARAALLIHLLESSILLPVDEINQRLKSA